MNVQDQLKQSIDKHVSAAVAEALAICQGAASAVFGVALPASIPAPVKPPPVKKPAAPKSESAPKGKTGQKRSPEEMRALVSELFAYITANPGQSVEVIGKAMGKTTAELVVPMKHLLADKKVQTEGEKRSTKYHPTGA